MIRQERRVDESAALHLVDPKQYRETEALHEGHVPSIAHDLGVANRCIEVFRCCLERLDEDVYVASQMGIGLYSARLNHPEDRLEWRRCGSPTCG